MAEAVPFYAGIDLDEIGGQGVRWQERDAASALAAEELLRRAARRPPGAARGPAPGQRAHASGPGPRSSTRPRCASSPAARAPSCRSRTPAAGVRDGDEVELSAGGESAGRRPRCAPACRAGTRLPDRRELPEGARRAGAGVARDGGGLLMDGPVEPTLVLIVKSIVIFAVFLQIVPLILHRRAQAARPLPVAHRPQPRRALRADAADRRRAQAALQGAVHAGHRGAVDDGHRAGDLGRHRGRHAWRSSRSARSTPGAATSASTASTSRSGSSTSSRSARWPSTG